MIRPALLAVLSLALLSLALTACATASSRHGPTTGAFDDEDGRSYAMERDSGGYDGSYASNGDAPPADAPAPMAMAERSPGRGGGFADALGGMFADKKDASEEYALAPPKAEPAPIAKPDVPAPSTDPRPEGPSTGKRLMIYTGQATVLVATVDVAAAKFIERVEALGGYIEGQNGDTSANTAVVTVRIPAAHFFEVRKELGTYGQVLNDSVQAQDVTKQVFDTELRLETATQARARLLELLKQATKMEDILAIEAEVRRLTDEIESMKGELRFLKDQIAFSTLTVSFYSNAPPPTTGPRRTYSRFDWINQVGPERVLNEF